MTWSRYYRSDGIKPSDHIFNYYLATWMKQHTMRSDAYKKRQTD